MDNFWNQDKWATVVGVVGDVRNRELTEADGPAAYFAAAQRPYRLGHGALVVRLAGAAGPVAAAVRERLRALDPNVPFELESMDRVVWSSLARRRFTLVLLAAFAGTGLLLAAVGIGSVVSYTVARRRRELGIRLALGARPSGVRNLVLRGSLGTVGLGIALGLVASGACSTAWPPRTRRPWRRSPACSPPSPRSPRGCRHAGRCESTRSRRCARDSDRSDRPSSPRPSPHPRGEERAPPPGRSPSCTSLAQSRRGAAHAILAPIGAEALGERRLVKLRLKPTRRLKRLRRHGPLVPRPRRAITAALLGAATPERWIHRTPPATPRSPSHPTGGKGTVDRMPPATPRSPSHPTGGKGTPPPSRSVARGTRLVRHNSGLIRHLVRPGDLGRVEARGAAGGQVGRRRGHRASAARRPGGGRHLEPASLRLGRRRGTSLWIGGSVRR